MKEATTGVEITTKNVSRLFENRERQMQRKKFEFKRLKREEMKKSKEMRQQAAIIAAPTNNAPSSSSSSSMFPVTRVAVSWLAWCFPSLWQSSKKSLEGVTVAESRQIDVSLDRESFRSLSSSMSRDEFVISSNLSGIVVDHDSEGYPSYKDHSSPPSPSPSQSSKSATMTTMGAVTPTKGQNMRPLSVTLTPTRRFGSLTLTQESIPGTEGLDQHDDAPLHLAVRANDIKTVTLLLEEGAFVDAQTSKGWTPLIFASFYNHLDIATVLLQHNANPDIVDYIESQTALIHACKMGHIDMAKLLLLHGADPNIRDSLSRHSRHYATGAELRGLLLPHMNAVTPSTTSKSLFDSRKSDKSSKSLT